MITAIRVIDQASDLPLGGAVLVHLPPERSSLSVALPLSRADRDGIIRTDVMQPGETKLVACKGYVSVAIGYIPPATEATLVRLQKGETTRVRCLDTSSNPVSGADVALSAARPGEIVRPQEPDLIGHPFSSCPTWTARTGSDGMAEIAGLPRGEYLLNVFHDHFIPISSMAVGGAHIVPPADVNIDLVEAYAAVAMMPVPDKPRQFTWNVNRAQLVLPIPAQARLGVVRAALQRRFADAMIFAGMRSGSLDAEAEVPVECQAVTDTGAVYGARWVLQTASSVEPWFLEPRPDTRVSSVRIEIRDKDGRCMPMDIRVKGKATNASLHAPGELLLPFGEYRVMPFYTPGWLVDAFDAATFSVNESSPPGGIMIVVMPEPLCLLRLIPRMKGKALSVIHIAIQDPEGRNHGMMNLDPGSGPWETWVPRAKIRIKVQSAGYRDVVREVDLRPSDSEINVELELDAREPR